MKLSILLLLIALTATTIATSTLYLFMKPGIIDPQCGKLYASTISVEYAEDEFTLSKPCQALLDLIGGMKGKKAADVLFMCTSGQTTHGIGNDDDRMKVVFFTSAKGPDVAGGGTKNVDVGATMQVTYMPEDLVLEASVAVDGVWDAAEEGVVFGNVACN